MDGVVTITLTVLIVSMTAFFVYYAGKMRIFRYYTNGDLLVYVQDYCYVQQDLYVIYTQEAPKSNKLFALPKKDFDNIFKPFKCKDNYKD